MGFFSGIFKGIKKVFKGVTKVVKKVVKGIGKLAKKVGKGVKGLAKKISKLGPLASIAIGFFVPPLEGALTGFISSGGKLKGALLGAAGGGLGYGMSQGLDAFKTGWSNHPLGESATFTQKLGNAFDAVGTSTSDGVAQMYNSTSKFLKTGDFKSFDYLTDSGAYRDPSLSKTNLFEPKPIEKTWQQLEAQDSELAHLEGKEMTWQELEAQDLKLSSLEEKPKPKSKYNFNDVANAIGDALNTKATTGTTAEPLAGVTSVAGLNIGEGGLGDWAGRGSRSMNLGEDRLGVYGGGDYSLLANKAMRLS